MSKLAFDTLKNEKCDPSMFIDYLNLKGLFTIVSKLYSRFGQVSEYLIYS